MTKLYQVFIGGQEKYWTKFDAAQAIDNGFIDATLGSKTMDKESGDVLDMSPEERKSVFDLADDWGAMK